ncbi:MAG: ABC transporter substrate-binding protein [Pseudorhodoplanes sp.]|nr:ABC transporter substrate-binding protein [Pseudorhodoplanes sp.]
MSKLQIVLSRMRARGGAAAILLSAALLFGADAGAQENVVRIGVVGPLTGDLAYGGQSQLRGAQLAAAEYNASQKNFKIEVIGEDDESKCDRAVAATRKLIARDKVVAILGNWFSTCSLAMVPITAQAKVPQYTVGIASPITQQGSEWIFRMALKTAVLNDAVIDHVVGKIGMRRIAILSSNEEGRQIAGRRRLKGTATPPWGWQESGGGFKIPGVSSAASARSTREGVIMGTGFRRWRSSPASSAN